MSTLPPDAPPRLRRLVSTLSPILCWLIIMGIAALLAWRASRPREHSGERAAQRAIELQGRYLVALSGLAKSDRAQFGRALRTLNTGPVEQRLRYVVLVGDLLGPQDAEDELADLERRLRDNQIDPTPEQAYQLRLLEQLYKDFRLERWDAPGVDAAGRRQLREHLGWFGDLALAPSEGPDQAARSAVLSPAWRTLAAFGLLFAWLGGMGFLGLALTVLCLGLYCIGRLRFGLDVRLRHGSVYLETFTLWLVLFLAFGVAAALLAPAGLSLLAASVASLLSLVVLAWPVLRGVPWAQVRQEIGWTAGRQPLLEPVYGLGCYAMTLPLLFVGLAASLVLFRRQFGFGETGDPLNDFTVREVPSHPIIDELTHLGWWGLAQVLFLASVLAPLVEETMFRGVLHRYLRERTGRLGLWLSLLSSGTVVSFLFAVIHPQGLATVPVLMAMAWGFTLAREWRGTLVPAMVAHGLSNGVTLLAAIVALGG